MFTKQFRYCVAASEDGEGANEAPESKESQDEDKDDTPQSIPNEVQEKARRMGWTPKEEWKGDQSKWRDAKDFVERGETLIPILNKRVKDQEKLIGEMQLSIKEVADYYSKTEERAYKRALKEIEQKQVAAVAAADTNAFMAAKQEMDELEKTRAAPPNVANPSDRDLERWLEDNPAFKTERIGSVAYTIGQQLRERGNNKNGRGFLDDVAAEVQRNYPEFFETKQENKRREAPQAVEGSTPPKSGGGKSFADMPKEARDTCERFEKLHGIKRADYVKQYFEGV